MDLLANIFIKCGNQFILIKECATSMLSDRFFKASPEPLMDEAGFVPLVLAVTNLCWP